MSLSLPLQVLAIAYLIVQFFLIGVMVKRKLSHKFPNFFRYMILNTAGLFLIYSAYYFFCSQYFYIYWTVTALSMLLAFGVLYEVFVHLLKPYSAVIDLGKLLFCWAGIFLLVASFVTALATRGNEGSRVVAAVMLLERSLQLMQCGLLLLVVIFEARLGLSWRSHGMSIAIGLGAFAAFDMATSFIRIQQPAWQVGLDITSGVATLALSLYWIASMLLAEPARKTAQDSPSRLVLQRWDEVLLTQGYGDHRFAAASVDSFIPGVEKAVERVLARKMMN